MRLSVITPVGPGHLQASERAKNSVKALKSEMFSKISHNVVYDLDGKLGRGRARNLGMDDSDWYFFLDADDIIEQDAARYLDMKYSATFGKRKFIDRPRLDIWPCGWKELRDYGSNGTLSMGFFVKSEVAKDLRFSEDLEIGEDFDFYMRLPDFVKVPYPLVTIGTDIPSTGGGHERNWSGVCRNIIQSYLSSGREYVNV